MEDTLQKHDAEIEKRFAAVSASDTFRNIVQAHNLGQKAVLDIGCSYGEHLAHFCEGSVGLTIAEDEALYGKDHGYDTRYGNAEDPNVPVTEKFDVIFANNIFEHLLAPHTFLVEVRRFLKEDGTLILGVPVVPWPNFLMKLTKFRGSLAVSHINFFTRKTLSITVSRAGWRVKNARSYHFSSKMIDALVHFISPHIYVVAKLEKDFGYHPKRQKELAGYQNG